MIIKIRPYLRLIRPGHYMKNLFLFLPLFFSGRLLEWLPVRRTSAGFLAFCMISSAVYIFNDIADRENDRAHSLKRSRPVASGAVSVRNAAILACVLICISITFQMMAGRTNALSWAYLILYALINIAYSLRLKRAPVVDVAVLAAGFLLRLAYGAVLTGIPVSGWLFLTVSTMSFYLALGKRRGELGRQEGTRKVLEAYSRGFLEKSMNMCLTLTVAFYSLWAAEGGGLAAEGIKRTGGLLWTVPLVIVICLKYSLDVEGDSDGDPVEVALHDKILCGLVLLLAVLIFILLYITP